MEENQTSLQENEQQPVTEPTPNEAQNVDSVASNTEATPDTPQADAQQPEPEPQPAPEAQEPEAEEQVNEQPTADDEPDAETTAEAEPEPDVFVGKTPNELDSLSNTELLNYLKEVAQITPVRRVRTAVDNIRAQVEKRFPQAAPAETPAEPQAEEPQAEEPQSEEPQAEQTQAEQTVAETTDTPAEPVAEAPAAHEISPEEQAMRDMLAQYDAAVEAEKAEARKQMEENANAKSALLEQMKQVVTDTQTTNPSKLLTTVKEIIAKWKAIGHIPSNRKQLNKLFHSLTEDYFSKLNIDRELRNLDMRRNLTQKVSLCEQAEALTTVDTTRNAFNQYQKLRDAWKAIGPVPRAESDAIWERFKAAGKIITDNFHKSNDEAREQEKENYKLKLAICEEVEALLATEMSQKDIEGLAKKAKDFTEKWRSIGFAPKSVNDEIYKRFRQSIDKMFDMSRALHKELAERYENNLHLKEALCEKAEAVMNSTDWRQTSDFLIALQKEWKEVGPVSHRHSDAIWKRFRKACDTFFDNKQSQHQGELTQQTENLTKKQAIIEELKAYQAPESEEQHLEDLKDIVARWNAIGLVPSSDKGAVNKEFAQLIGKQYDALHIDRAEAELEQYRGKLQAMAAEGGDRLRKERQRMQTQVRQAEQTIETLENNILFFAKSKTSDKIVSEFNTKIAKAREELEQLNKKMAIANEVSK